MTITDENRRRSHRSLGVTYLLKRFNGGMPSVLLVLGGGWLGGPDGGHLAGLLCSSAIVGERTSEEDYAGLKRE
jgi:hypothetical protein